MPSHPKNESSTPDLLELARQTQAVLPMLVARPGTSERGVILRKKGLCAEILQNQNDDLNQSAEVSN